MEDGMRHAGVVLLDVELHQGAESFRSGRDSGAWAPYMTAIPWQRSLEECPPRWRRSLTKGVGPGRDSGREGDQAPGAARSVPLAASRRRAAPRG